MESENVFNILGLPEPSEKVKAVLDLLRDDPGITTYREKLMEAIAKSEWFNSGMNGAPGPDDTIHQGGQILSDMEDYTKTRFHELKGYWPDKLFESPTKKP